MSRPLKRHHVAVTPTKVDLHVKVLSDSVVDRAKERGLDAIVYAPHFRRYSAIRERAARFSDSDLAVIPGRELFTGSWRRRKHVLALDLSSPIPDFITLEGAMAELQDQDAVVLAPHPTYLTISLAPSDLRRYREVIDATEVYNPKFFPHHSRRARRLQRQLGLPSFGSSYAHLPGTVGEAWTEFFDAEPTVEGVIGAIRRGDPRAVERRNGAFHLARRVAEIGHVGFENTVEKFDRVVVSGREDTHPDQPAYEGRFDDVRVY